VYFSVPMSNFVLIMLPGASVMNFQREKREKTKFLVPLTTIPCHYGGPHSIPYLVLLTVSTCTSSIYSGVSSERLFLKTRRAGTVDGISLLLRQTGEHHIPFLDSDPNMVSELVNFLVTRHNSP
jgi:hypothetical protein